MGESSSSGGRGRLFWQVSALVLVAVGAGGRKAEAAPAQSGGITLDLQGQYALNSSGVDDGPASQDPAFRNAVAPGNGYTISGEITYQPSGSPWSFGVGVRYGRMQGRAKNHSFATTNKAFFPSGVYSKTH